MLRQIGTVPHAEAKSGNSSVSEENSPVKDVRRSNYTLSPVQSTTDTPRLIGLIAHIAGEAGSETC
jgi:hypothetical protein